MLDVQVGVQDEVLTLLGGAAQPLQTIGHRGHPGRRVFGRPLSGF